jgi:hypothetical protein
MWAGRKDDNVEIYFVIFVFANLPQEENRSE